MDTDTSVRSTPLSRCELTPLPLDGLRTRDRGLGQFHELPEPFRILQT